MARSEKKGIFIDRKLFKLSVILRGKNLIRNMAKYLKIKTRKFSIIQSEAIKLYRKSSKIIIKFVGFTFLIHNGLFFNRIVIDKSMVGFRFGEFVLTKRMGGFIHKENKLAKKKAKQLKQIAAKAAARKNKKKK